jgi:hypothetical protein
VAASELRLTRDELEQLGRWATAPEPPQHLAKRGPELMQLAPAYRGNA